MLTAGWPSFDPELLTEQTVTCVVQVDGTLRDRLAVPASIDAGELRARALASPKVIRALGAATVRDVVVRAPRLVNVVSRPTAESAEGAEGADAGGGSG